MRVRATLATVVLVSGLTGAVAPAANAAATRAVSVANVVPAPVSAQPGSGAPYALTAATKIYAPGAAGQSGELLARVWRRSTGFPLPVVDGTGTGISLTIGGVDAGYRLESSSSGVSISGSDPANLFAGTQTLRQLVPADAESASVRPGPWPVAAGTIVDKPRLAYRGAMLDVARHFFTVAQVQRYIDQLAQYKINYLHLHLADDQGWRIMINSWPRLATYGGSTQVGGGKGGYYTQDDFAAIVGYAAARYITVVPEIDMPGHTNAALASYAELNCNGKAPALYTGTGVGFSSLCTSKEVTYKFLADVVRELAALTPGPYLHVGGDEADATKPADYKTFMNRVQQIVADNHKSVLAWHQVVGATPLPSTVAQYWGTTSTDAGVAGAAAKGTKIVQSPANKAYLDMKYTKSTKLGQDWAGLIEVKTAYDWDPATYLKNVPAGAVLGVEAPLWTETIKTSADIEYMAFPRLPALAELGWSPASTHNWSAFSKRLGAQGPRWTAQGINFYRSPQVPWAS
jgi:hexosaminidase